MPAPKKTPAAKSAAGDRVIDLDAARAARAEKNGPAPIIRLGGKDWTLPVELPADFAILSAAGDLAGAMHALLGEQFEAFWKIGLSMDDLEAIADQAAGLYGVQTGES